MCKFLYFIIFVPYNLFRLFLVHKILASKYICENGKKKKEKKKEKGFPASWAGGGFRPSRRERAQAGALSAQLAQPREATAGDGAMARGPHANEGGLTAWTTTEGEGGFDRSPADGEIPRRFSAVVPVSGGRGGGLVRLGVGGHGGGVNLVGGHSGWPAHSEVAASAVARSTARLLV